MTTYFHYCPALYNRHSPFQSKGQILARMDVVGTRLICSVCGEVARLPAQADEKPVQQKEGDE